MNLVNLVNRGMCLTLVILVWISITCPIACWHILSTFMTKITPTMHPIWRYVPICVTVWFCQGNTKLVATNWYLLEAGKHVFLVILMDIFKPRWTCLFSSTGEWILSTENKVTSYDCVISVTIPPQTSMLNIDNLFISYNTQNWIS